MKIPANVRDYALKYQISIRRDSNGIYSIVEGTNDVVIRQTTSGIMAAMRRYVELGKSRVKKKNPPDVHPLELIYGRVLRIEAQKIGPHRCDPGCKKADHHYFHDFDDASHVQAWGMSDGTVRLVGKKKLWGMF